MRAADETALLRIALDVCLVGLAISSLESLASRRLFRTDGVYSWSLFRRPQGIAGQPVVRLTLDHLFAVTGIVTLLALRLVCIGVLFVLPLISTGFRIALSAVLISHLMLAWRRGYGDDGSDQMTLIILIATWIATVAFEDRRLVQAALWFIALQAVLSYSAAGISKLASPVWREGAAVYRIFSTATYGVPAVARILRDRQALNLLLCWSVMVVESVFVLALLLPLPAVWFFLLWGGCFHLMCALIMGLNTFLWAFLAAYPAVLYAATTCNHFIYGSGSPAPG
jgi:hypothetical protein